MHLKSNFLSMILSLLMAVAWVALLVMLLIVASPTVALASVSDNSDVSDEPSDTDEPDNAGASVSGISPERERCLDLYADAAIRYGAKYGMPWEVGMAIYIYETDDGTSRLAVEQHNLFGMRAKSGRYQKFDSDEECWEAFYKNLVFLPCYTRHNVLQHASDPFDFLEAITEAGYNPDPETYVAKVRPVLEQVVSYREENSWPTSEEYLEILNWYDLEEQHPTQDYAVHLKLSNKKRQTTNIQNVNGLVTVRAGAATYQM